MQFESTDRSRYVKLKTMTNAKGRAALTDLCATLPSHTVMHCEGSGYRLERGGGAKALRLRGVHRTLHRCLWSKERFGGKSSGKSVTRFSDGRTYYGMAAGLARGKDVHEQIGNFVMIPRERYNALYPEVDPMTHAALSCLAKHGYLGVHAEYIVYHERLCLGTAVDLVCLDKSGALVFVEIKTGYQDAFLAGKHNSTMSGPFSNIVDSPLNRARTQILYAQALYASNHRQTPRGCVLHIARDGTAVIFDMGPFSNVGKHAPLLLNRIQSIGDAPRKKTAKKRKRAPLAATRVKRQRTEKAPSF